MRNHGKSRQGKSTGRNGRWPGCARMEPLDGCVPFLRRFALNLVRAREKRYRAVPVVDDINRVGRVIQRSREGEAASSFVLDLDMAIIHVACSACDSCPASARSESPAHREVKRMFALNRRQKRVRKDYFRYRRCQETRRPQKLAAGLGDNLTCCSRCSVELSNTETVRSSRLPMNTVFLSNTMPTARGAAPAGNVATTF